MTISLEQALIILEHQQQQMLAFQQQLFETVLNKFFTKQNISGNKGFICNADNGAKMAVSEEHPVEGSTPFTSDEKCKMVSDDKEKEGSVDKALSLESNEAPLNPPISEDKLQSEVNYGLHDIGQESWKDAYPEKDWNSTINQIVPDVIQNHREIKAYNESASYPVSHVSLPDMGSRSDAHNFDENSYEDEKNNSCQLISRHRPRCPILTVTRHEVIARQIHLYRGVHPIYYGESRAGEWYEDMDRRIRYALDYGKKRSFFSPGCFVIIVTGWKAGSGSTNTLRVVKLEDAETKPIVMVPSITHFDD